MYELKIGEGNCECNYFNGITQENFLSYAKDGFFEGTIFHRVIKGFMIQGGGFTADMDQKDTKAPIKNEANNGLVNKKGSIAMARTQDPHSATAQFFINTQIQEHYPEKLLTKASEAYTSIKTKLHSN